jgi:hypothetical protein
MNPDPRCFAEDVSSAAKIKVVLNLEGGRKVYGWPKADGAFSLTNVPEGTHLLDVVASGLIYPQVRVLQRICRKNVYFGVEHSPRDYRGE